MLKINDFSEIINNIKVDIDMKVEENLQIENKLVEQIKRWYRDN